MPAATFSVNDRVTHSLYGPGTITEMNVRHVVIAFDEHGTKKFLADVVQLEKSNIPAPAKPARSKGAKKAKTAKAAKAKA